MRPQRMIPHEADLCIALKTTFLHMADYILVADDDPDDLLLMEKAIDEAALSVNTETVSDGDDAIEYLEQCGPGLPKAIILDLNMPRVPGMQVLKHIRSSKSYDHIPVYILTTSSNSQFRTECLSLGANAYVTKPNTYSELLSWVNSLKDILKR